jgi:hypothetical protein
VKIARAKEMQRRGKAAGESAKDSTEAQPRLETPDDAVYVGRPSRWGNPFRPGYTLIEGRLTGYRTNEQAVNMYRDALLAGQLRVTVDDVRQLAGWDLACWCYPSEACHADVLLELANP